METFKKKLFSHGGSKAVDLPKEAVKKILNNEVTIEVRDDCIYIPLDNLTNMESDSKFHLFIEALFQNAMKNPDKLQDLEEVWDKEWEDLLSGVDGGEEI